MLNWDEAAAATGFAITVDGVRTDVGLAPTAPDGSCGCSYPAWFIGGRHQVVVSAYNASGETSALPVIVGPTASAGGPYQGVAGSALAVSGAGSVDATAAMTKYDWSWGDGSATSGASAAASHSYTSAGTYTVTLTVTDADGASHSAATTATITPPTVTLPSVPSAPSPADTAVVANTTVTLTWTSSQAINYDVYFGTTTPPPLVVSGQAAALYAPASLTNGPVYYWRVVARNSQGTTTGPVWSFTTAMAGPASSLLAAFGFSEGVGTSTADVSGNGGSGLLVNGTAWTSGKNGAALAFNGSNSYVDLGNPANMHLTGSMTLSAWVYETANVGDDGQIIAKSDGVYGWQLKSTPDTGVRTFGVAVTDTNGNMVQRYSKTVRALNTWYYVAGVYDAAGRTLNIYVNGTLDNGTLVGAVPSSQRDATVAVNIGQRTGGFNIAGKVDEVRVYSRALTQAQIQADMNAPPGGLPATPGSPAPAIGATGVSTTPALTWAAAGATSYDVRLGPTNPPALVATGKAAAQYAPSPLATSTTYYWQIVARNAQGSTTGPVWTFSTVSPPPATPGSPAPATGAAGVSTTPTLTWAAAGATSYDVRFGATNPPALVATGQAAAQYAPSPLATSTTYYWQIVSRNTQGSTTGPVWTFSTSAAVPIAGLVASYGFAEGVGLTTADLSGKGNTGLLVGGPSWTTGKYGSALSFNGSTSFVDLGNPGSLRLTGSMTLSAWVYETANVGSGGVIIAKSDGVVGWQLKSTADTGSRTFAVSIADGGGKVIQRFSKTVRSLNTWYYVTGVYDTVAKTLNIYVNGVLDNGALVGKIPPSQKNSSVNVNIGRRTGGFNLAGIVDDVRIYNVALTQADIQAAMTTPVR